MSERRWNIGGYEVKYNPSRDSISHSSATQPSINVDGSVSSHQTYFNGDRNFTIDLYDEPTYVERTPRITFDNEFVAITEKRMNERIFLLDNKNTIYQYTKNGVFETSFPITNDAITTNPDDFAYMDNSIAVLYSEASRIVVSVSSEAGQVTDNYSFSVGDITKCESMSWDFSGGVYLLNPYGSLFHVNTMNGTSSFIMEMEDFSDNEANGIEKYKSVSIYRKDGLTYISILDNKGNLTFYDGVLDAVGHIDIGMRGIVDISFCDYSRDSFILLDSMVYQYYPNTARLDLKTIKNLLSKGQVTMHDDGGFEMVLDINNISTQRLRNLDEDRYRLNFRATIAYERRGFDGDYFNFINGV